MKLLGFKVRLSVNVLNLRRPLSIVIRSTSLFGVGGSGRSPVSFTHKYLEEEGDRGNRALSPSGQRINLESDGPGRHFATLPIHVAPSLCAIS